jgi:hypothetical protein
MLLVELLVAEKYHEAIASGDQWVKSSFDSVCAHQKIPKHQQLAGQLRSATRRALISCQPNANNSQRKVQTRFSINVKENPRTFRGDGQDQVQWIFLVAEPRGMR